MTPNLSHISQHQCISVKVDSVVELGKEVREHESGKVGSTGEVPHSVWRVHHSSERTHCCRGQLHNLHLQAGTEDTSTAGDTNREGGNLVAFEVAEDGSGAHVHCNNVHPQLVCL